MKPNRDRLSDNEGNLSHAESVPKHDKRAALPDASGIVASLASANAFVASASNRLTASVSTVTIK
jgi:hypothetical protein